MATAPKKPQDHKKKAPAKNARFSFEVDEKKYTLDKPTKEVLSTSFYRRIRKGNGLDQLCDMVEHLTEKQETLDAFDLILDDDAKLKKFEDDFEAHCKLVQGATPGESEAS